MSRTVVVLPGDYIGPEVVAAARTVLEPVAKRHNLDLTFQEAAFGGAAIDSHGTAFPEETLAAVKAADAVFLGSVGGPVGDHPWNRLPREQRIESGLLTLRQELGVFANLRPVTVFPGLEHLSPLQPARATGTDLLIMRELTGGIYFGKPSHNTDASGLSTMVYERYEVERIARQAFEAAKVRRGHVTSVDKANVLDVSQFWRDVVVGIHESEYPTIELSHLYVDNAAMQIATYPQEFDVVLTGNLFGDILSDLAAVIPGSLGVLPSASLGGPTGLFEPVHGSAPDIAGTNQANPTGAMLSAAMMLRYAFHADAAASELEAAVRTALTSAQTPDLGGTSSTSEFTNAVLAALG